jgi:hypothetical protein
MMPRDERTELQIDARFSPILAVPADVPVEVRIERSLFRAVEDLSVLGPKETRGRGQRARRRRPPASSAPPSSSAPDDDERPARRSRHASLSRAAG